MNDLFLLFDKHKFLIAETLSYVSVPEMYVLTRNNKNDLDFSQEKELWKLTATAKYPKKKLKELEQMLTLESPLAAVVKKTEDIDYFRLMLADYITKDAQDQSTIGNWPYKKGGMVDKDFTFVFEKSKKIGYDTREVTFQHSIWYEPHMIENLSSGHRHKFTVTSPDGRDNDTICNLIRVAIFHALPMEEYKHLEHSHYKDDVNDPKRMESETIRFEVRYKSFLMLFRIMYGILQIPGVLIKFEYEGEKPLFVHDKIKL